MLKILLCDDDPFFLSLEKEIISRIIEENQLAAAVVGMASSGTEAFTFLSNNPGEYLVFLDLDFGKNLPNGIDISAVFKQKEAKTKIVFTTNHHEMAMNVLKSGTEPFGFLEKGANMELLAAGFRRYISMALRSDCSGTGEPVVRLTTVGGDETVEFCLSDILYLEAEKSISHGITYHTVNGSKITILGTLDEEGARLGDPFLRVHRSYLAAKKQILDLRDGDLVLTNQQKIPCSLRMRAEVKKWLRKK